MQALLAAIAQMPFPTDAQPLLAAALAGGTGKSRITETIFDRRFRYTEGLCAMGDELVGRTRCT